MCGGPYHREMAPKTPLNLLGAPAEVRFDRVRNFCLVMTVVAVFGCGGTVNGGDTLAGSAPPGGGAAGSAGTAGDGGIASGGISSTPGRDAGPDAIYHDPVCSPAVKVQGSRECDVFSGQDSCGPGAKCAPYVKYAMDCQSEEIGTQCVAAGFGMQGDDCANDLCAPGFVCVSGGVGLECAQLCHDSQFDDCPPGLLCGELDVDGFFVCG